MAMHELTRARSILFAALRLLEPGLGQPVSGKRLALEVEVSPLAGVDEEELRDCFLLAARGTAFAEAELRISRMTLRGECAACGATVEISGPEARCCCGKEDLRLPVEEDWKITGLGRRG